MSVFLQGRGAEGNGDPYAEKEDKLKQIFGIWLVVKDRGSIFPNGIDFPFRHRVKNGIATHTAYY